MRISGMGPDRGLASGMRAEQGGNELNDLPGVLSLRTPEAFKPRRTASDINDRCGVSARHPTD